MQEYFKYMLLFKCNIEKFVYILIKEQNLRINALTRFYCEGKGGGVALIFARLKVSRERLIQKY